MSPKDASLENASRWLAHERANLSPAKRAKFLDLVAGGLPLGQAAVACGSRRSYFKALLETDEDFAALYKEARGYENDNIRNEIRQRAFDREDAASAKLLEIYAKSRVPEFKQKVEHDHGGQVEVTNPDVTAAIDRFTALTAAAIRAAARKPAELTAGDTD